MEIVLNYLITYYPQVGGYLLAAFVLAFVVWKISKFYLTTQTTNKDFLSIKATIEDIRSGFSTLNQVLLEKNVISNSCFSSSNSPRAINQLGIKLMHDSGADKLFQDMKTELIRELENAKFDSFLELEQESLDVLLKKMNDTRFKRIQNFAFEHPKYEEVDLTYIDILHILSLKLRDAYLEKYPKNKLG